MPFVGNTTFANDSILSAKHDGKTLVFDADDDQTLTVPKGLPRGFQCRFVRIGDGEVEIAAASGVTINSVPELAQYESAEMFWTGHNNFVVESAAAASASTEALAFAVSDETTDLEAGTAKLTFRMPYAFTVTSVRASVTTAPTGSTLIVDINEAGSSILSTKLSIDAGEKTSATAAAPPVISDAALADNAEITIDIDQIGSTIAGTGLKVYLIGHQ